MTTSKTDYLRKWADDARRAWEWCGSLNIQEPKFSGSGLVVELILERTVAQVVLWPSGMLDLSVLSTRLDEAAVEEHYEIESEDHLCQIMNHFDNLIRVAETGDISKSGRH